MGIISRLFGRELRAQVISADDQIMKALRGVEISPETAMEIPAVSACVGFISSCIAGLPVKLYREDRQKNITEEVKNDIRLRLLNDETGDMLDPFQMKQAVVRDYFLYGSGFIYPEMNGNECISLRYIRHNAISSWSMNIDPICKMGEYVLSNGMRLRDDEVIRLLHDTEDGLRGQSYISQHQQLLSAMYREIVYEKMLVSTGGNKKGFLTAEKTLTKEMLDDLRQKWNDMYANTGNTMMILNKGLTFHESSNTSVEMQLNENKVRNNELVCQVFGMSADFFTGRLGDEAMTAIIKNAVIPVITALENALDRGLLLPSERDLMYFTIDTTELLKGDILKRYQAYKTGLECNVLQIDEARYKEDLPPLGLNWIKLGLQDVLYDPKTKMIYTPNMNQSMQMTETPVSFENEVDKRELGGIIEEREAVFGKDHKIVDNTPEGGDEGSASGGLTPDSKKAQEHADRYYESVRKMKNDHEIIAKNTEFSAEEVKQVKDFIFLEKHDLGGSEPEHFYPSYEMAQSWQRLIDGKNIQKHDITLIKHELMEKNLIAQGYSQNEAHKLTEQKYDYATESREYYAKADKHKDE